LRQLRRELVLQLYLKQGRLWEAVSEVRDRWNIEPKVQLPRPAVGELLLPEGAPKFGDRGSAARKRYAEYAIRWEDEMAAIRDKVVPNPSLPTRDLFGYQLERFWKRFFPACVLYDPPAEQLSEFASYGNPELSFLTGELIQTKTNIKELPGMVQPPIKSLWDLMEVSDWYWRRILDYIGERYLEPEGMDPETLLERAMWEIPGLEEEYWEKYEQYARRYYIEVDAYTSLEDVRSAFQMIRSIQRPKRNKPPRDRLTAVQCAILYDHRNQRKQEDKRQWRWTFKTLAEELGLMGPRAAKYHVELGREILAGKDPEES
jgi:hypothetical protein